MKTSFDWPKAVWAALVLLALPFIVAGFLAFFVWFGIYSGWFLFGKMLDWVLTVDDPEIEDLTAQAVAEIDALDEALERFIKNIPDEDVPEWMRD